MILLSKINLFNQNTSNTTSIALYLMNSVNLCTISGNCSIPSGYNDDFIIKNQFV